MDAFVVSQRLGYVVALITVGAGVLVMIGLLIPETVPDKFRMTFGVILILTGVYRFAVTRLKKTQKETAEL